MIDNQVNESQNFSAIKFCQFSKNYCNFTVLTAIIL